MIRKCTIPVVLAITAMLAGANFIVAEDGKAGSVFFGKDFLLGDDKAWSSVSRNSKAASN
ncbi:hypothetical protein GCM10011609_27410 [Lentzea pudingi]|uniref:Uncharacterized protein n=1 Tax=Lentzea pudingi TaxID=1789439 RepID=A0ABQ2HT05_9PSEU|nr:hypothetical protein [Lentzea pudingi]GGM89095.1 hypothetical protein GCM10011609_27410 [Lentzea pudingi]